MPFLQTDIDALKVAIATGAETVRYADGREVTYRSLAEMERILALMLADVLPAATASSRTWFVGTRRGLYPCTSRYYGWYR